MQWRARRENFRAILNGDTCIHPASVFDPLSARIAEHLGFEVGLLAGSTASLTVLGAPDLIVLTATEFAAQALRINRAMSLPLLVDADHGYGNALNVARTVEELTTAGVSAASIEDTNLPLPYAADKAPALISIEEGVGKMRAALAARPDPAFCVVGRTSAPVLSDIDDTIKRMRAYEQAGVDALFIVGLKSQAQLAAVSGATTLPLILGNIGGDLVDADLSPHRVRIALQGHATIMAAVQAVYDTMKALRDGTRPSDLKNVASPQLMKTLTRAADYDRAAREYLAGK
ncbi:MAG: isocitrate lyase/PEP mutase family protein [Pseudolabrys sp.]